MQQRLRRRARISPKAWGAGKETGWGWGGAGRWGRRGTHRSHAPCCGRSSGRAGGAQEAPPQIVEESGHGLLSRSWLFVGCLGKGCWEREARGALHTPPWPAEGGGATQTLTRTRASTHRAGRLRLHPACAMRDCTALFDTKILCNVVDMYSFSLECHGGLSHHDGRVSRAFARRASDGWSLSREGPPHPRSRSAVRGPSPPARAPPALARSSHSLPLRLSNRTMAITSCANDTHTHTQRTRTVRTNTISTHRER